MGNWLDAQTVGFRSIGVNVTIYASAKILCPENITIGSNVIIDDFVFLGAHQNLVIGNHVHIGAHSAIIGGGNCYLSDFFGMSSGVTILTGSDDFLGGGLTNPTIPTDLRKVHRGRVWCGSHSGLGANVVMLPDTALMEGAVVAAGSVVTKTLLPWKVYGGNPARAIKARPSEHILRDEAILLARAGSDMPSFRSPCPPELLPEQFR